MNRTALILALAVFAFVVLGPGSELPTARAEGFYVVDSTGDDPDAIAGDGFCQTTASACTLRAAIQETNANGNPGEADIISFANGSSGTVMNIRVTSPLPTITDALVIAGQNANGASCALTPTVLVSLEPAVALGLANGLHVAVTVGMVQITGVQIGGFGGAGILIEGGSGHVISCSHIGVDIAGTTARPNGIGVGVRDTVASISVGFDDMEISNVISGNGVGVAVDSASGVIIRANYIGIGRDGSAIPNSTSGVFIRDSSSIFVGAQQLLDGNTISANDGNGVYIESESEPVSNIHIRNNAIGYAPDGATPMPNGLNGVQLMAEGSGSITTVTIGDLSNGSPNEIYAGGSAHAVSVRTADPTATISSVLIRGNRLVSETGLAINLRPSGEPASTITPNDFAAMDADTGPNTLLNFPVLTTAYSEDFPKFHFSYRTAAFLDFSVDFYAVDACGLAGNRSVHRWLGSTGYTADANGDIQGQTGVSSALAVGEGVVAVVVDNSNNTSEISNCVTATLPPPEIGSIQPRTAIAGQSGFTLTIETGYGPFAGNEKIVFDGTELTTIVVDNVTLSAFVPSSAVGDNGRFVQVGVTTVGSRPYFIKRSSSDMDCSGQVTALDSLSLLGLLAGLVTTAPFESCAMDPFAVGDANQSGATDIADAVHIRGELADLVEPLPGEVEEKP